MIETNSSSLIGKNIVVLKCKGKKVVEDETRE